MAIRRVPRLTGPQYAQALKQLEGDARLESVAERVGNARTRDPLALAAQQRLMREGIDPTSASAAELRSAVAVELACIGRELGTRPTRSVAETLDLRTVAKNVSKAAADLLVAVASVEHVPGALDTQGKVPIHVAVAMEVDEVLLGLGGRATPEGVVHEMQKLYQSFDEDTLLALQKAFPGKLPSPQQLLDANAAEDARDLANVVADVIRNNPGKTHSEVVQLVRARDHLDFDARALRGLYRRFGDLRELAAASRDVESGLPAKGAASNDSFFVFDTGDPVCRMLVARACEAAAPMASVGDVADALNKDPLFRQRFGEAGTDGLRNYLVDCFPDRYGAWKDVQHQKVTRALVGALEQAPPGTTLANVVEQLKEEHGSFATARWITSGLVERWAQEPELFPEAAALQVRGKGFVLEGRGKPAPKELPPAKPGVYDESFVAMIAKLYDAEPSALSSHIVAIVRTFDPTFVGRRLRILRNQFPEYKLGLSLADVSDRQSLAAAVGHLRDTYPLATAHELGVIAREQGLPFLDERPLNKLAQDFPDELSLDALHVPGAASVAKASAVSNVDGMTDKGESIIEQYVRDAKPGDTLKVIHERINADPYIQEQHGKLHIEQVRTVIQARVPEASDWKVYNVVNVARVLHEYIQNNPDVPSLSRLVKRIKADYPGFPSYVTLCGSTQVTFEKHLDKVPWLLEYRTAPGKFKFGQKARSENTKLTPELRDILAAAFRSAPIDWTNEDIFKDLLENNATIQKKYPNIGESTLTALRTKYGRDAIPRRTGQAQPRTDDIDRRTPEEMLEDAHKLARQLSKEFASGAVPKLNDIAAKWGVDPQYFRRLINKHPSVFPHWKKRYPMTEHRAKVIGAVTKTLPIGATIDDLVRAVNGSGLMPVDMKFTKASVKNYERQFPELVPNLKSQNEQRFLRVFTREVWTAKPDESLREIVIRLGPTFGEQVVSWERLRDEFVPAWNRALKAGDDVPVLVKQLAGSGGEVPTHGLGKPRGKLPVDENAAVERELAQIAEIPQRLEMVERMIARRAKNTFADFNVLNIQHLLGSNYRFIEAIHRMGCPKEDILTVGIPYSTSTTVAGALEGNGFETMTPPLNIAAWERQVEDAIFQIIEKAKQNDKPVVVFDDGGLVAKILHERPWAKPYRKLFRIVEQTTRGITVASKYDLDVPIVNYAQDQAKDLEGPMIGDVVLRRMKERLGGIGKGDVKGKPITVNGFGVIGSATAVELAKAGAKVTLYDPDPDARKRAVAMAKKLKLDIKVLADPEKAFAGAQMIVGCTGHPSITRAAIDAAADGCVLVSTSSKLVEIDMGYIDERASGDTGLQREPLRDGEYPPSCKYTFDDGKEIVVLADGFPVNFDGQVNCVEPDEIQLTHAGMLISGIQATWKDLEPGFVPLDDRLRAELIGDWKDVRGK